MLHGFMWILEVSVSKLPDMKLEPFQLWSQLKYIDKT